jgi:hypothetical protein
MFMLKPRREREKIIVLEMIRMYCEGNHSCDNELCTECQALTIYAEKRLKFCRFGETKPVCKECPVHCYSPERRNQMRLIMQYSGPRMMMRKPVFALSHVIDNLFAPKSETSLKRK